MLEKKDYVLRCSLKSNNFYNCRFKHKCGSIYVCLKFELKEKCEHEKEILLKEKYNEELK